VENARMLAWRERLRDPVVWGGIAVFVVTQIVYILTLGRHCPFWDSGEFIATSYTLGIPHPPGTPLYVMIGRIFTLLPIGSIATRVNYLSAFAAALAVLFSYLIIVMMARRLGRGPETPVDRWLAIAGGLTGAFFMAFSRTFWESALEAETYALASFVMVLCIWLMLRWQASGERGRFDSRYLLLIGYLFTVSIGIYLGAMVIAPALFVFLLAVSPATFFERRVLGGFAAAAGALLAFVLLRAIGLAVVPALLVAVLGYAGLIAWKWPQLGWRNLATWMVALAVLGLTVQLFLIVRSRLDPMINEAEPSTWQNLWLVLSRDQYKPANPFLKRQASWAIQFSTHFWRYWRDQFDLGLRPGWFAMALPYAVGIFGAVVQALRDRKRFILTLGLVFMTSVFLVFYLNFKEDEVRDRDYFFTAGYQFFALWIGVGATAIARWLRGEGRAAVAGRDASSATPAGIPRPTRLDNVFGLGAAAILVTLSFFPAGHGWHTHDRTDFEVARDYAYNMLVSLEPNAIIFTNGDNDTFPLWYIQEVEHFRRDVRVVNLSLLNTPWYIRQVRDYEPRMKITIPDREIDELRGVILPSGKVVLIKDMLVHHIVEENPDRPIYIAVTVPELMDLDKRLVMEGLVFRVVSDEGEAERVDVAKTWENLRQVYRYNGLLDAQGNYDTQIYKDSTARKLVQNYVAAYVRIAHEGLRTNNEAQATEALEYARRINPNFPGVLYTLGYLWLQKGDHARAEQTFRELVRTGDTSPEVYELLGASLEAQGRYSDAEEAYRDAVRLHPDDFDATRVLFTLLWSQGRREPAVRVIEEWLQKHPDDNATRLALQRLLASDSSGASPGETRTMPAPSGLPGGAQKR
jgi:tetratricopeptide (TPR) repeat protein